MLAEGLGRRALLAGLMLAVLAVPVGASQAGSLRVDEGTVAGVHPSVPQAVSPTQLLQVVLPEAEVKAEAAVGTSRSEGPHQELPVQARVEVGQPTNPYQPTFDAVLAQLPVDILVTLAQQAQQAADEARRALPDLGTGADAPAREAEAEPASVSASAPSHMVLGATIIAVGAAAAATFAAFWMAGSSGSVGAAAAAKGGAEMRRLLPFASPLFTRFGKDTVLGHPRREALYARILQEPGISLQALGEATGLSRTAVVHHLRLLEQQHLIVSRRVGRGRHYFENGGRYGHDQKEAYAVLQNDRSRAVAEAIRSRPGMMQKTLCAQLSIPPSIAHWHVTRLVQANLVQVVRQGRTVAYFPGQAMPALNLPALPRAEPAPMAAPMPVAPA